MYKNNNKVTDGNGQLSSHWVVITVDVSTIYDRVFFTTCTEVNLDYFDEIFHIYNSLFYIIVFCY